MKKLIILFTLVAVSFSADKWEYKEAIHTQMRVINVEMFIISNDILGHSVNMEMDTSAVNTHIMGLNNMGQVGWELIFRERRSNETDLINDVYFLKRKI